MFLLQCAFRVVECSADEQSSSVPLSLGSVAKRYTKQVLRDSRKVATLKQQVHVSVSVHVCVCVYWDMIVVLLHMYQSLLSGVFKCSEPYRLV